MAGSRNQRLPMQQLNNVTAAQIVESWMDTEMSIKVIKENRNAFNAHRNFVDIADDKLMSYFSEPVPTGVPNVTKERVYTWNTDDQIREAYKVIIALSWWKEYAGEKSWAKIFKEKLRLYKGKHFYLQVSGIERLIFFNH